MLSLIQFSSILILVGFRLVSIFYQSDWVSLNLGQPLSWWFHFRFQIMVSLSDDSLKRKMEILSILATMVLISIVLSIFLSFILEADLTTTLYYRSASSSSDDKKDQILSVNRSMMTLSRLGGNIRSKMTGQVLASIFKSFELKSEKYLPETQK